MSKKKPPTMKTGTFGWNELITTDVPAAKKFYTRLFGWKTQSFAKGMDYTLFKQANMPNGVGGMMKSPQKGTPAQWISYVMVADVDATVKKAKKLGGKICMLATDIPGVGRIAVLTDPQGATIAVIKPKM